MHQGSGFDPQSVHMQESANESINKWNDNYNNNKIIMHE